MPGVTPLRPDDVRSARAWAAFVADDAGASAPASLEARVLRAAQAALAQKQRDDAERRRRHWFAGCTALAASLLAAAAWSLAPRTATTADSTATEPGVVASQSEPTPPPIPPDEPDVVGPQRPLPMTNVEAGRVLAMLPRARLASRPLFDAADGVGPTAAPGHLRAKSFGAPTVEPTFTKGRPTHSIAEPGAPALAAAPTLSPLSPTAGATAPEVWSSRGFNGIFDPDVAEKTAAPPIRLDQAAPAATPREDPPAPPK